MALRLHRTDMPEAPSTRPKRRWSDKFAEAIHGVKEGIRGQSSFFVHFFVATLVVVTGIVVQCDLLEWCVLVGCIGLIVVAELFNSAIEVLFRGFAAEEREKCVVALHVAAGAVLCASVTAALIGLMVLGRRLWVSFVA